MMSLRIAALLLLTGVALVASRNQVVEVYFVVEPSVLKAYMNVGYSKYDAIQNIKGDMDLYVLEVNKMYKTMLHYGLQIEIRTKKLTIMDKAGDLMFEDCKLIRHKMLQADLALEVFKVWLDDTKAKTRVDYDVAVVLTGFDIFGAAGNNQVTGYATTKATCNKNVAVAVVEMDGTLSTAFTIAHEVGHSLGSPHDQTNECSAREGYIMTPTGSVTNKHRWEMSSCSIRKIKDYIESLDKDGKNCLLKTTTPDPRLSLSAQMHRDILNPEKICQRVLKDKDSYFCSSPGLYRLPRDATVKGDAVCKVLYCAKRGSSSCRSASATDGMVCDVNKRCDKGVCVGTALATPRTVTSDCVFGDMQNNFVGDDKLTCKQGVAKYGTDICYSYGGRCCGTCKKYKTHIKDCPFGDKNVDFLNDQGTLSCTEGFAKYGAMICQNYKNRCCKTCAEKKTGPSDCPYGDGTLNYVNFGRLTCKQGLKKIGSGVCYDSYDKCCKTCSATHTGIRNCEYGDRSPQCAQYTQDQICKSAGNRALCCQKCHGYVPRKRSVHNGTLAEVTLTIGPIQVVNDPEAPTEDAIVNPETEETAADPDSIISYEF